MRDVCIVHESILYNAFGDGDEAEKKNAEAFLNKCGELNYERRNIAYFPGEVFERIQHLTNKPGWEAFLAFCEMLIIKYSTRDNISHPRNSSYVNLASDLCVRNRVCIISTNEKFNNWVNEEGYLFPIYSPKMALSLIFE